MTRLWLGWLVFGGLAAVFAGMRVFEGVPVAPWALGLGGAACVLAGMASQLVAWRRAENEAKAGEAVFALAYAGCALAMVGFLAGSDGGLDWLGADFDSPRDRSRFKNLLLACSSLALACAAAPAGAAQWAARKGRNPHGLGVDARRIRETAAGALGATMLGGTLLLLGFVASKRNRTADFSYFKTSVPGEAVQEIVRNLDGQLRTVLFFPEVNSVKDELVDYFRALGRATDNVVLETYDRFEEPALSAEYDARNDGDVFLRLGDRRERIGFPPELVDARSRLVALDGHVQEALLQLVRDRRVAYATTGHGEYNDPLALIPPGSDGPSESEEGRFALDARESEPPPPLSALRKLLDLLGYDYRDLSVREGLGDRIPDDAAMVMIMGPRQRFLDSEIAALRDYLDNGGSLMVALEPESAFRLADLEDHLGVARDTAMLVDDMRHLRLTGGPSDARLAVTNRFSTHPSVTTASREGASTGIAILGATPIRAVEGPAGDAVTPIVRSLLSSFVDRNGNFRFDGSLELRDSYDLAVAVERPTGARSPGDPDALAGQSDQDASGVPLGQDGEGDPASARALVYGDAEMFTDPVIASLALNAAVLADGIRWLGREEEFAGRVESEEDVPIVHTRSEDVVWFYAIIFAAPILALAGGVAAVYRRRPRHAEAS